MYAPTCHGGCKDAVKKLVREISKVAGGCTVHYAKKYSIMVLALQLISINPVPSSRAAFNHDLGVIPTSSST